MRWNKRITLVVRKNAIDKVREIMLRHGYGPDNVQGEAHGKNDNLKKPVTHYYLDCAADDGLAALAENILVDIPGVNWRVTPRNERVLDKELGKQNLKRKPRDETAT